MGSVLPPFADPTEHAHQPPREPVPALAVGLPILTGATRPQGRVALCSRRSPLQSRTAHRRESPPAPSYCTRIAAGAVLLHHLLHKIHARGRWAIRRRRASPPPRPKHDQTTSKWAITARSRHEHGEVTKHGMITACRARMAVVESR